MGIIQTAESGRVAAYIKEFTVDKEADIANLPTMPKCKPGSSALCIETSAVYVLGTDNQWHIL